MGPPQSQTSTQGFGQKSLMALKPQEVKAVHSPLVMVPVETGHLLEGSGSEDASSEQGRHNKGMASDPPELWWRPPGN